MEGVSKRPPRTSGCEEPNGQGKKCSKTEKKKNKTEKTKRKNRDKIKEV